MAHATVLVVDDNQMTRKLVRLALESEGYTVREAEDGRTALRLAAAEPPDLILQDLILPDVNGLDLVRQLRALPGGAQVPILAFSGFLTGLEQARALGVGFTDYLFKPVEPSRLLQVVDAYLAPPDEAGEQPGAGRRVLVVDDDPIQLKLLELNLAQLGFEVVTAADGEEALAAAHRGRPDAIVADVLMPRLDGFMLCLAVRQDPELMRVPVILMSAAYTEDRDRQLARTVGADALVSRTPDLREVIAALLKGLRGPSERRPMPAGPPPIEQYTHRVIRQLEHQARMNASLSQRLAQMKAEVAVLVALAETLRTALDVETVLAELLQSCLDAAGVSRGAAYLHEADGSLSLRAQSGYSADSASALPGFFGHLDLLRGMLERGEPEVLGGGREGEVSGLLQAAGAVSILAIPLVLGTERLGVVVLASELRELTDEWLTFARVVGSQVAHGIGLARALAEVRANEERIERLYDAAQQEIAERKRAEAALRDSTLQLEQVVVELRQTQRQVVQQERLRALGQMAGGIAHDFNNALAQVVGYGELLLDPAVQQDPRQLNEYLSYINEAAADATAVVGRLREFYRPREAGEVSRLVELKREIEQAVALTRPRWKDQALARGSDIDVRIEAGQVPPVAGVASELREVLTNLIFNAVDAMPGGGLITLATELAGDQVVVRVADSGTGMSEEVRLQCLEPFFTTKGEVGTGLGLSVVHGIIRRHGGSIAIESEPGRGTTFAISLPRWTESTAASPSAVAVGESICPKRILLLEDLPQLRWMMARLLALDGHSVVTAGDGREGLERFGTEPFDLVITDRAMPEMGGDHLAALVKQQAPDVPVVMLTGFGELMLASEERPPGVDLVVSKPATLSKLRAVLTTLFETDCSAPGESPPTG